MANRSIGGALAGLAGAVFAFTGAAEAAQPYSWRSVPFGAGGFVDGFLYHPKAKDILYARTDIGGAYRYDYAAKRWIPLLDSLNRADNDLKGVLSMAVDPNDPNKLYFACGEYLGTWARVAAVLRSDDKGQTWKKTDLTIRLGGNSDGRGTGDRLQVDPNAGEILFLGANQDGLWKSTDGAKSFAKAAGFPGSSVSLVLFDPASGAKGSPSKTIWVGSADGKGGLYVSHDAGASFALAPGAPRQAPQHAAIAPDGGLYVTFAEGDGKTVANPSNAVGGGVWRMDLKTGQWRDVTPVRPAEGGERFGYSGVDVDPAHPGTVVVSTLDRWGSGDDVFETTDGGAHWMSLGSQSHHDATPYPWLVNYLGGKDKMGHWIADVKINPFNPDEMIYGTGFGLWMSRNLTAAGTGQPVSFDFAVADLEETATIQMTSPSGGATLLAAFGDVGGAAWDDVAKTPETGLFKPTSETNYSVDSATLKPAVVVRTADKSATHGFYSTTGGADWSPFPSTPYTPKDAKGEWRSPGVVAVSAGGTSLVWAPQKDQGYHSSDMGKTWAPSAGWPADRENGLVPVADKAADHVFYLYDRVGGRILISVDDGASFKPIVQGIPAIAGWQSAVLAPAPGRVRDLWLAGPNGLLHSPEGDKPMASIPGVKEAWLVTFGKAAPGQTYPAIFLHGVVKDREGIWRSDDEGKSWTLLNDAPHQFGRLSAMAGDPLEYGVVYIAPDGRGVMVGRPAQ
jgi:hypothetical protein